SKINVKDVEVTILNKDGEDYICITDMVKSNKEEGRAADVIKNWIRNRGTIEFLGAWERLYNPDFKVVEFDHFKKDAGLSTFTMSVSGWVEKTSAIGIFSKPGKYGGTYAHKDIAFEFGTAISPEFKLLLIKEFQRLKDDEERRLGSEWDYRRFLTKINYQIHTDAVKYHVLPALNMAKDKEWIIYANEADLLNVALFGMTGKAMERNKSK
ncbi:MAG TPA: KilA-N domain-containing protein, partial [Pedobacter sp.]